MKVEHKITECFLGRAITLTNGTLELTVTLDVGPRIISFKRKGGFNIMYEDVADNVNNDCSSFYGAGKKWHIYGGHRLWLSPEDITTYYPDNEPIDYVLTKNGGIFSPKKWEKIEVQPSVEVEFLSDDEVKVTHKMINVGKKEKELCLWALTVMRSGGEMKLPLSTENTGLLANRNLVMWSYCSFKDERFDLKDDVVTLKSSPDIPPAFKFGAYKRDLTASYTLSEEGNTVRFSKTIRGEDGGKYPDYTCNFESYCTHLIHEIETLSPMKTVKPGEELTHEELWKLEEVRV